MFNTNRVPTTSPDSTPSPDTGASWDSLAQMGRDDPANRTTWDDLATLANQMGKIPGQPSEISPQSNEANAQANEDTQTNESNTPASESVSQPGEAPDPLAQRRREVLDFISSTEYTDAAVKGTLYSHLQKGDLGIIRDAMLSTEEGAAKFQKDFIDSGIAQRMATEIIANYIQEGKTSEAELSDLSTIKSCNVNLLADHYSILPKDDSYDSLEEVGRQLASFLYENDLFDKKSLATCYDWEIRGHYPERTISPVTNGIIDFAASHGVFAETNEPDIEYWSQLSVQNGKNMVDDFNETANRFGHDDNVRDLVKKYDFAAEPVMRLFLRKHFSWSAGDYEALRKPLENPAFQDAILDQIDAEAQLAHEIGWDNINQDFFLLNTFSLLASNHKILKSMLARNAFAGHTQLGYVEKLKNGTVTDLDTANLFIKGTWHHPEHFGVESPQDLGFFDAEGNITYSGIKRYLQIGRPAGALASITPETYRQLFDDEEYNLLAGLGLEFLDKESKLGLSRLKFMEYYSRAHSYSPESASLFRYDEADIKDLSKCFDKSHHPTRFFAELVLDNDRKNILSHPDLTALLDQATVQFLKGEHGAVFGDVKEINKSNIISALTRFIYMDADDWTGATKDDLLIKEAFSGKEAKELALSELRNIYEEFLNSDDKTEFPKALKLLSDFMHKNDGAGPLSQIEAFLDFAGELGAASEEEYNLSPAIKQKMQKDRWAFLDFAGELGAASEEKYGLTLAIEQKMQKDRWTNQEKSNFYAISAEVLKADHGIYREFAELFANIPNKDDFKTFATEIYPLYRAKLALLRDYEDHSDDLDEEYSEVNYDSVDMIALKNQLHTALLPFNLQELDPERRVAGIGRVREIIFGEISELFQSKFGILPKAIPSELTEENFRAIKDMTLYLSNLAEPTEQEKDIIGYFLALQLGDGLWDKLRSGVDVPLRNILNVVSAFNVSEALMQSRNNNPINNINTRIESSERLAAFRTALQSETSATRVGNVQSIDLKLQNLMGNINELTDPDLYPEGIDRQRVALLNRYPAKQIGRAAATLHQIMAGRPRGYSEGDQEIADAIVGIMKSNDIEITPENVKQYFQSGLSGIKEPFNIADNIRNAHAAESVQELQKMLTPPDDIAQIFGRLGEEFKPQSGVMALSADLDFLENLVAKKSGELNESELESVKNYIDSIRNKMADLDKIYERLIQNFNKMKKSIHNNASDGVRRKIEEIDDMISNKEDQSVITSTCTNEMTTIIENMRACLSAKTKGINNDTDLTFGEGYKFYLYSNSSTNRNGSIADEIIYFVPVGEGEERRLGFVMDQVYGNKNSDILMGHVETILKKARNLKQQFPEVPISVILPTASMSSCGVGMTAADLEQKIENRDGVVMKDITDVPVTVPESGFGDHYIEFGGDVRTAGPRNVSGIEITL